MSTGTGHTILTKIWHCGRPFQLAATVNFLIRFLRSSWKPWGRPISMNGSLMACAPGNTKPAHSTFTSDRKTGASHESR